MSDHKILCGQPAAYRFTWPGRTESFICEAHSIQLRGVAQAMGLSLQLLRVPVTGTSDDETCKQKVTR